MFKLESYITPILLSYVNRYISNLKPEDSQVSLWGGDATFHNLELNLQVLEQELQLPFSFVSGSIRELCIHVPWTKLTSEPITITINTIECILNLKGKNPTSDASAQAKINKTKKPVGKDVEAPQGYVQLLINKIVSNIRIHCNNLILKYVEEDIVLSMNVKHLKYQSANKKWEAAYTDLSPTEVTLRKIITVNDLTLCLDKRNASGKIEVYQEPMLYRCSMTMHLLKHYHSTSAKRASTTRLDIYCNNMEFSMTEQQVPMLLRLLMLLYALQQKKLKPEKQTDGQGTSDSAGAIDDSEIKESWTGWAWSYVSAVLPAPWEEEDNTEDLENPGGHTLHLCIYVDTASVTFKVSESSAVERGTLYPQKKMRYNPMLVLKLQGLYTETVIHGMKWFNAMGGIGQAVLLPVGPCSCGEVEITDEKHPSNYLEIGSPTSVHKKDSLFDGNAEENKGNKRKYNRSWDYHMTVFTEAVLLERTPAFAFDYLYQLEVPSDTSSDILSDFGSDYEFSNFTERCGTRVCLGPLRLRVCSGLLHRGAALRVAASHYDYPPYYATPTATADTHARDLRSPAPEEVDALRQFVPQRNVRITLFAPILELELMDHPFFQPVKGCLLTRKKKVSMTNVPAATASGGKVNLPKVTIECQFLDVTITYPMYANRVVHATCQLPDAPKKLFDACFTRKTVKVVGLCSRLLIGRKHTTILTPSSLSYCCNAILLPHYWMNPNIPHNEITFESESVTLNATNAKMMVIVTIISKLIMMDCDGATKIINTTTMLLDACKDYGFPYMELYIEGIRYKRVVTNATTSMDISLGSIKAFIFEKVDASSAVKSKKTIASEDIQQVLFLSGPEAKSGESTATATASRTKLKNKRGTEETPLLTVTFQYPLSPENQKHAPILLFNLQEIRICVDPLLCKWLLYHPRQIVKAGKSDFQLMKKISKPAPPLTTNATSASEASGGGGGGALDTPRRLVGVSSQSVHSSLDREPIRGGGGPPPPSSTGSAHGRKEEPAPHVDLQEKVYNVLRKWFEVWKGVYLCGDVSQCTVYFPLVSLSAVGSQGIQEAVELAVNKEQPPELMVITLPFATVRSSHRHQQQQQQQHQEIKKYLRTLPVTVPDHVWTPKSSSLPWTVHVADLSCYTVQHGNKLTFLKPVSLSATIGLSTKPPKVDSVSGGVGGASGGGGGAGSSRGGKSKGSDIGYLGICVHIDMTPILVSTSEVQVYLFASILYGLMEVATNLMPKRRDRVGGGAAMSGPPPKMADVIPSQVAANNGKSGSSAASPSTAHKDHTFLDSNSDKSSSVSAAKKKPDATAATTPDSDHIKLTAWVQWTITRFTIELLSNECQSLAENDDLESQQPRLKLVVDAEDIVSSLDLQSVYLKIKSKIGSASIQHFKRSGSKWKPGPFSGTVMRLREDVPSSSSGEQQQQERHDDQGGGGVGGNGGGGGFICVTITRASCQHTHTLWGAGVGAAQHAPKRADKKAATAPPDVTAAAAAMLPPSKYITEIVVNVQPIDFVISLRTLRSFYLVLAPLLEIPLSSSSSSSEPVPLTSAAQASPSAVLLQTVNSQALPLAYLDCRHIRLVMPSVELGATGTGAGAQHDVIIFQVEKISLAPSAVNPICRTPIRQDIYDQAVHARILNIPGSEVEDRQYQLDVCGMGIATGTWQDMDAVFSPSGSVASPLHSLSENPAVEWNNLDSRGAHPCFQRPPSSIMNLWNVTERFDISVVAAPAILYRSHVIVCGHSLEINFVSDIVVNLSLNQIKLVSAILSEFVSLVEPLLLDDSAIARPKIIFPYSRFEPSLDEIDEWEAAVGAGAAIVGGVADSGIDTSDIRSVPSSSKTALTASDHQLSYARRHSSTLTMVYTAAPVDVLFTAGKIGLSLYQIDDDGDYVGEEARPPPSLYKQHRKKKRPSSYRVDHDLHLDDDKGYDAEEESAEDGPPKMYKPLVFVMVKQPNVFVSKQAAGRRMQVSWYDVNVKLRGPEYLPVGNVPTEDDYPIGLLETRCGQPHPNTGILPAFFTLKYVKPANNKQGGAHLDVEIAKPTKLLCSMSTWSYLLIIRDRLVDTFKRTDKSIAAAKKRENDDVSGISHAKRKAGMNSKFQELKETLRSVNSANLRCGQIVFEFKSDAGHEVNLALEKITANLTLFNRPEKVSVVCGLHSVTLNVVSDRFRKILLNPWTVTCDVAMFWESWQTAESNPQIQVSVESECIMLDVSPEQIRCVQSVLKDVAEFASSFRAPEEEEDRANGRRSGSSRPVSPPLPAKKGNVAAAVAADKEQHYKDDLRAGAFQFVDANTDNVQELPMPYQVAFWNKASLCAMAWRYPQPRALTKVRVFPVPYKTGSGSSSQEDLLVLCHLEYWSECRSCYLPYTHFYLSESEVCHLTLPEATPKTVVASTWRVVITTTTATGATETDGEQKQSEQQRRQQRRRPSTNSETAHAHAQALISPRALAACMRVDSYFDRSLVPNVTAALYLTKIELALYTHFDKQMPIKLPDCLKTYTPDFLFPDTQRFLSVVLENLTAYSVCWDRDVLTVEVSAALKCNVLDYMYLTEQSLVDPFTFKMDVSLAADALNCNLICKPIQIKVGPTVGHTLAVSSQLWSQSCRQQQQHQQQEQENEGGRRELVVMTRYVVCNDTNVAVRFGQTGTDEAILLPSRCFHLYAWRSQRNKEHLKLALDDHGWTRSFSVARDAVHTVTVDSDNSLTVIVTVKSLSATQKQVIFSGQLIVSNTLLEHFDLKVVEEVPKDSKESEFKNSPTYVVAGKSNTCSIFVNNRKNYFLRLRFYGLDSAWTGDIPLREHATGSQPWLVKVPLQERGQFLSIWCRVIVQEVNRAKRTLAVLWPLFSVKSNLPISSNVHIETPTLNVHLDSLVKGRGELQQLYCPGTIDHSHQLTFRIDNSDPIASPYVPLNYSLVDHQQFFKKPELEEGATIEDILKELSGGGESTASWPYFGDELDDVDWIVGEQPLTHVQVKYQASCRYSCSLLVELVPWCLTVNTLGVPITINVGAGAAATDAVQLCKIPHYGIVAPPKLEENFNIGVCSGGTWCYTEPLQLAKSDWSQSFYMPKFTGTIPLEGCVRSAIVCDGHVCMLSLASTINNDIRLLKVSSTHVLSNHMAMQVQVICLAVPDEEGKFDIPVNMDRYCFTVAPHLDKSKCGISVIRWHTLTNSGRKSTSRAAGGAGGGGGTNYALYMSFSLGGDHWSCPIRVDKPLLRKSFAVRTGEGCSVPVVLTSQDCKGGSGGPIYLTLHEDDAPQLFIENTTGAALYVAQATGVGAGGNDVKVAEECEHFRWRCRVGNMERAYYTTPGVSDKFPDLPPAPAAAASSGASGAGGSTAAAASWAASSTAAAASDGFGDRIAIASEPDGPPTDQLRWSNALTLRHDNDQFLRIPYYGDIRVRVANTACTTIVLLESVSQVEISARDIRVRLLMQEITNGSAAATTATAAKKINGTSSEPGAGAGAGRKRAARMDREDCAGVGRCQSDTSMIADTGRQTTASSPPPLLPDDRRSSSHTATRGWSETDVSALSGSAKEMIERPLLVRDGCTSLTFNAFVKSLVLVFVSDVQFDDKEKWELMSLVCDDLVCRAVQVESLKLKITTSDVQLDNQLYARESYDFPVVVVGQVSQEKRHPHRLTTLNVPIDSLIEDCDQNALLVLEFTLETWCDKYRNTRVTAVRSVKIIVNPLSCYIEDIYVTRLMEYFNTLTPNVLVMLPKQKSEVKFNVPAGSVCVPEVVSLQCAMLAKPLTVRNVLIAPISLLLSVHSSIKLYIALDQSPLQFGRFERKRLLTTPYRLGHALTMHYLSGAIFGAGWVVSSLELLGSPGGLARAMGTGLRDFVSLPCRGIFVGPMAFLRGITQGSASLMRHITAGTLQSVTKLASSVARNLDRLTLDEEHLKRTEEQRRQRPQGLAQGFMQGLTGLGISLLGAVGGIAHHPLQSMIADGASPRSLAAGVGLGLVGIVTKPLSGAAELVALTGQGLLQGAGWSSLPEPRSYPQAYKVEYAPNSTLKYSWKHVQGLGVGARMLFALEATSVVDGTVHDAVALILTTDALLVVNLDRDDAVTVFALADLHVVSSSSSPGRSDDPTVLRLKLAKPPPPAPAPPPPPPTTQQQQGQPDKTEEDFPMEMDPVSRARVADYVKSTVSLLNLQDGSVDHSEISISPLSSPGLAQVASDEDATCFTYYVSPQNRNYFVYLMKLAKLQLHNYSFPVL